MKYLSLFLLLAGVTFGIGGRRLDNPTASEISRAIAGDASYSWGVQVWIAASDSAAADKNAADAICDGVDDDTTIKTAIQVKEINSFEGYYGVTVHLAPGVYVFGNTLDLGDRPRCIRFVGSGTEVATVINMAEDVLKPLFRIGRLTSAPTLQRVWFENLFLNNTIFTKLDIADNQIASANTGARTFSVTGNYASQYTTERPLLIESSTDRLCDKYYTITDITYSSPSTVITVAESIPSSSVGIARVAQHSASFMIDAVAANSITINGSDYTDIFTVGYPARVLNSTDGTNDGYYTISAANYTGGNTVLTTVQTLTTGLEAYGCIVANVPTVAAESWGHGGLRNCIVENSIGDGLLIMQSEFLHFESSLFKLNGFNGIHFAGYTTGNNNANYVQNCMFDQVRPTSTSCVRATVWTGTGGLYRTQISNNWIKESAGDFVTLTNGCRYNKVNDNIVERIGSAATDTFYFVRLSTDSGQAGCRNNEVAGNTVYSANTGSAYAVKAFVGLLNYGTSTFDQNDTYNNKFFGNPPHIERSYSGKTLEEGIATRTGVGGSPTDAGNSYDIVTDIYRDVKPRAVDNVLTISTIGTGGYYDVTTTPAISNVDYPRNLSVTVTDADAGGELACNVWVYFLDDKGTYKVNTSAFDFTPLDTPTKTGTFVVSDIIEVRVRDVAGVEAGDTITIGLGDMFGLSRSLRSESDLISVSKNGVTLGGRKVLLDGETRSYKVSGSTIDFGTDSAGGDLDDVADGDDFVVRYRVSRSSVEL